VSVPPVAALSARSHEILVVDDDDAVRRVVLRCLEQGGFRVTEARNGIDALRIVEEKRFDLVITDVVMPDMEGLQLVRALRKLSDPPRIIVMSGGGRASPGDYLGFASMFGANATLAKPFLPLTMLALVREVLKR
jgi:CheY-like chemotaxis protein